MRVCEQLCSSPVCSRLGTAGCAACPAAVRAKAGRFGRKQLRSSLILDSKSGILRAAVHAGWATSRDSLCSLTCSWVYSPLCSKLYSCAYGLLPFATPTAEAALV